MLHYITHSVPPLSLSLFTHSAHALLLSAGDATNVYC